MNRLLAAVKRQVDRHGAVAQLVKVAEGVYDPETLTTTNTETTYKLKLFKNHIRATQYNYPSLVGKDATEFYLSNDDMPIKPEMKDKIVYAGDTFVIDSIKENWAFGVLCLYQIIAVKN